MKALLLQTLALISLTAVATFLTWKFHPYAPALSINAEPLGDGEISVEQALEWHAADGVFWVDARSREKFEKSHITGAVLLNEFELTSLLIDAYPQMVNQDNPIVVYCGTNSCKASHKIADYLRERAFPEVYILKGGWDAWVAGGGATATGAGE